MPDIICPKCKIKMEKGKRQIENNMEAYICRSCGLKKNLPKSSPEKLLREQQLKKLDREKMPEETNGSSPEASEDTQLYEKSKPSQDTASTVAQAGIDELQKEIKKLKAVIEIKDLDSKNLSRALEEFSKDYMGILDDLKSSVASKIRSLENLIKEFQTKFK
jgi:DNA-directed RNA polymerase subunit M/transcription elongation factor TFIIS